MDLNKETIATLEQTAEESDREVRQGLGERSGEPRELPLEVGGFLGAEDDRLSSRVGWWSAACINRL